VVSAWPEPPNAMSAEKSAGVHDGVEALACATIETPPNRTRRKGASVQALLTFPENFCREQKCGPRIHAPTVRRVSTVGLLPDGDIVRHLKATGQAHREKDWPCYHSELYTFTVGTRGSSLEQSACRVTRQTN
jgi:hypothetical protein